MRPLDRHRQTYRPAPEEKAPPAWAQALGLLVACAALYLTLIFTLSL
jgi:hypothetical protein